MKKLKEKYFNPSFSHIYVEKKALKYHNTRRILQNYSKAEIVEITHYKDVFSRGHQNFRLQKKSPKLILAVKEDHLIYRGAPVCEDFGNKNFFYTSTMMNCLYNCQYCYLQGMYTSANIVVFVNIEDYFLEVEKIIEGQEAYLCISYDTDLLAFEKIVGYVCRWVEFARGHSNLKIELRTKSAGFSAIKNLTPLNNFILAWTLSPDDIIKKFEVSTPSLDQRLSNIKAAIDGGWNVRICIDPILYVDNWMEIYKECIEKIFKSIPYEHIYDISLGVFRVSKDYLKKMRKSSENSLILNYPYVTMNGICSYQQELDERMLSYVYKEISRKVPMSKIYMKGNGL